MIVEHVAKNKKGRPVYTAITVSAPYTTPIQNKLYLTGLAYKYSTKKIDSIALLKKNIEQLYALDYIKVYFPIDISYGNVNSMNGNYLLPFAVLSKHYSKTGDKTKAEHYKDLALKVATAAEQINEFEEYFGKH